MPPARANKDRRSHFEISRCSTWPARLRTVNSSTNKTRTDNAAVVAHRTLVLAVVDFLIARYDRTGRWCTAAKKRRIEATRVR